jgi:ParB family transcriptional regulator, chromosome partitioning protein
MQIINKSIKELTPYEKNPRKNQEAVKYVANSIKEFGFKVPIVIDAEGVIVAGHTRVLAAKQLGLKEVPCIVADDLSEEQVKAYRLADNKTAEIAEWDIELLNTELLDLEANFDMADFGFEIFPPAGVIPESNKELDEDEMANTSHECPKCGFKW